MESNTLKQALLLNEIRTISASAEHGSGEHMGTFRDWLADNQHFVWAALLIVIGYLPHRYPAWFGPWSDIATSLGDAALIAGLLTLAVDPFLKRKLVKEASKGIFKHMLGFNQPPEIQDRLEEIVTKNRKYAKDTQLKYKIEPLDDEHYVNLHVTIESHIFNPSHTPQEYTQEIDIEAAEEPSELWFGKIEDQQEKKLKGEFSRDVSTVFRAKGWSVTLNPESGQKGFVTRYTVKMPSYWYNQHHFAIPTIGVEVFVEAPNGWKVGIADKEPVESNSHVLQEEQLFMQGEHIDIRWEPPNVKSV